MASLFGPTPQELIFARMREDEKMRALRNQQIGQEGGEFGVFAPLYQAGRRFGEVGSQAIVKGLFPEAEDPSIRQAQAVQLVRQKYQGQDFSNPSVLQNIASDLFNAGAPEAGLNLLKTAQDITPKEKKINEIGKTPQGLQVYQEGNEQFYLKEGQRIPYYGSLRQETVAPTGTKQIAAIQGIRGDYLKEVKPEFEAFSSLDSAKRSLTQLSGIGDELAKRQLLKASGESGSGLSNKDVAAFASFGPLGQRIAGTINRFLEGTYSDDQRKEIISLIDQLQGQLQRQADEKGKQYKDFASGIEGVTPKDINFITPSLSSIYRQNAVPFGTTPAPTQGATGRKELTTKTGNRARILPSQ
jgi:hypothetical protein